MKDFFKKGENVFREGEKGNEMYILQSGKVEVIKNTGKEDIVLATLEPKAFFGEMALFGDPSRSATIRASEDTKMVVITRKILDSQLEKVPEWFVSILKSLVGRLREANRSVKSRFRMGPEFSILKGIYLFGKRAGEQTGNEMTMSFKKACEECSNTLAISEKEFKAKLKKLMFVRLVRFSEPKDILMIPDAVKLKEFMTFLRNKSSESEGEDLGAFGSDDGKEAFEKMYNLLIGKKL